MSDIDKTIEQITSHNLFLRFKDVVEHAEGWHDHEAVFDHLVKTANIAKEQVNGDFITNPEAKELFDKWMNEEIGGMKRKDLAVLTALVHDCGKILSYKEDNKVSTLITNRPTFEGQTLCPGHEFWGGEIVASIILKDVGLNNEASKYIQKIIKLHDAMIVILTTEGWLIDEIVNFAKSRAEGMYKESLFNLYCDGYTAPAFEKGKVIAEKIFNTPSFYIPRTYFIP